MIPELKVAESLWDVKLGIDGVLKVLRKRRIVDLVTLAKAAGVTVNDNTTLGDIQTALVLSDTNTIQDAINTLTI